MVFEKQAPSTEPGNTVGTALLQIQGWEERQGAKFPGTLRRVLPGVASWASQSVGCHLGAQGWLHCREEGPSAISSVAGAWGRGVRIF